jgi:two-component system NtrC family response regulator
MQEIYRLVARLMQTDLTVMISGESGTGKELVARALHRHSARAQKPFIAVNCAAIPADLLESELFGHVKGSFTGATANRAGAFRDAHGGTLFLDEIGDMSGAMQAKILRALQERIVSPVGGGSESVDVRIVAATHRDMSKAAANGEFRQDLYYRLNVITIALPSLRERRDDIVPLAEHFLRLVAGQSPAKRLKPAACERLLAHSWPGNVRELRNVVERANVLVRGDLVDADDLAIETRGGSPLSRADLVDGDLPSAVARLEKAMILEALAACRGNRAEAARRLNIHRQLLYTKMQRYGLGGEAVSSNPTPDVGKADT